MVNKILDLARKEIGTRATGKNNVKYNTAYYGRTIHESGYAWCAVFLWWLFRECGASDLYYGGGKTAYCPTLMSYHRGQAVTGNYKPGDIIFFNFNGKPSAAHVGLCEAWDGTNITTIDGNTSATNEAAGGTVARRVRNKKYIVGAYRPAYKKEEEEVTQDQFNAMMDKWLAKRGELPPSDWAKEALEEGKEAGITEDGDRPPGKR